VAQTREAAALGDPETRWVTRLRAGGLPRLSWLLRTGLRTWVLPAVDVADPRAHWDHGVLADLLVAPLHNAIIEKLRRRFPRDAKAGDARLLRWRAKAALRSCLSALAWAEARLLEDLAARPNSLLSDRMLRLTSRPILLPDQSGRGGTAWGMGRALALVALHDRVLAALRAEFPAQSWTSTGFTHRGARLRALRNDSKLPFIDRALDEAAACEFLSEAVYVLTARAAGDLAPETLRRVIRRGRPFTRALDEADRRSGRPIETSPRPRRRRGPA
jgi:hypothetical protein